MSVAMFGMFSKMAEALEPLTGEHVTVKEIWEIGERISNLQRAFNLREGVTAEADHLPSRLLEPFNEGLAKGQVPDVAVHIKEYYQARGWDPKGVPTEKTLTRLGLDWITPNLH